MIATWLAERFGLTVPIVAAPMSGAANGSFAAAVCRAGGLGMIGISDQSPADVRGQVATAAVGGPSYGIGLLAWLVEGRPDLLDVVIELRPPLVSLSYGDYGPLVATLRAEGITVATQIGTVDEASQAVDAGVDVIVARGSEGGGHGRDAVATLPLLEAVLDRVDLPGPRRGRNRNRPRVGCGPRRRRRRGVGGHRVLGMPGDGMVTGAAREGPGRRLGQHDLHARVRHRDAAAVALAIRRTCGAQHVHRDLARPRG